MRNFDYSKKWEKLLTPEIVTLLTQIHEYKGKQSLFIEAKADTLTQLVGLPRFRAPRHPIRLKVSVFPMPD